MLTGKNLIAGQWAGSNQMVPSADPDGIAFAQATEAQVDEACRAARSAFREYAALQRTKRAKFLRAIAEEIDAQADTINEIGPQETGLPVGRFEGERGRTMGQLRMFADLIEEDAFLNVRHDEALPERQPLPRPDLRLTHRPIGPVVVFGASNFPLAFSTAGGDTASALAAGCPVIVKGHQAHAGVAEIVGQAVQRAAERTGMPTGTFQILQGSGRVVGQALVRHPEIRAVGFTGSLAGGRALYDLCHMRPQPIPFYGELGSVNPVFLLPGAMATRADELGRTWAESLTMGAGQFCTNPGIVIALRGPELDAFCAAAATALSEVPEQKMLTDGIHTAFVSGVGKLADAIDKIGGYDTSGTPRMAGPSVFVTDTATWLAKPELHEEVFGPSGIVISCADVDEFETLAEALDGQLTVTLQLDDDDHALAARLLPILEEKAGRILCNGFPTGVEVSSAMMHGGPYPASTDVRATSVGTLAIMRWLRPVSYQNVPETLLLHPELQV
ncbi:aldehyde dehydrogenase (NADP(+)) [Halomonas sp. 86]|uniref:aldehyde dehydrogenase (NADP(+)) n=1 Tax=unclassified Halomonas TaxID=2609666 RepID=UPI004033BC04